MPSYKFDNQDETCFLSGSLTQSCVIALWEKRHTLLTKNTQILDLSNLNFIDSAGLAFLITLQQESRHNQNKLLMVSPSNQIKNLIILYNLQNAFAENF